MTFKTLILLVFIFTVELINAQTDFRAGYVINLNCDTLIGEIDYRGDLLMGELCRFRTNDKRDEIKYSPDDIAAYRFNNSKYFISKEVNGRKVFLEFLIKGQINIYYLRDNNGDHYFLEKEDAKITEIPYEEGIKYEDGVSYFYSSTKHIGLLNYCMRDAPDFQSRISKIGQPEHENLIKLAKDYHNKVCKDGACIIYEKKQSFIKVNLEVVAGLINFQNIGNIKDKYYFQSGVIAHWGIPRMNEKIYLKTGLLHSQVENTDGKKHGYTKIPIQIGYMAPNTYRIRPSFSIGLFSPSYSGGFAAKISKRINLGIQSWANFHPNNKMFLIPKKLSNYSILGNLYIEL